MTMSEYRPWSPITRVSELVLLTSLGLSIALGLGGPVGQRRDCLSMHWFCLLPNKLFRTAGRVLGV